MEDDFPEDSIPASCGTNGGMGESHADTAHGDTGPVNVGTQSDEVSHAFTS